MNTNLLNTHEYSTTCNRIQMNTNTEYEYPMSDSTLFLGGSESYKKAPGGRGYTNLPAQNKIAYN